MFFAPLSANNISIERNFYKADKDGKTLPTASGENIESTSRGFDK